MRSLALANQKGGVGKTTTAIHLAHGLAIRGDRVALFDLDPQGNATVGLQGMGDMADAEKPLRLVQEGLWLLDCSAAHARSRHSEPDLDALTNLVAHLESNRFDWLIVDCPPRMDAWGWAGLQLCKDVLVPVQAEFFAMHGLSQMLTTLEEARAEFPTHGNLIGVLPTIVDWREPVSQEVVQDLRANLGPAVLQSMIFKDCQLVEAASHGVSVFVYNPLCKAALCFGELVREVVDGRS